jgi:hypothetical protein
MRTITTAVVLAALGPVTPPTRPTPTLVVEVDVDTAHDHGPGDPLTGLITAGTALVGTGLGLVLLTTGRGSGRLRRLLTPA